MSSKTPKTDPNATTMKDGETSNMGAGQTGTRKDKDANTAGPKKGYGSHDRDAATRDASRESETRRANDGPEGQSGSREIAGAMDGSSTTMRDDSTDVEEMDQAGGGSSSKNAGQSHGTDHSKRGKHA